MAEDSFRVQGTELPQGAGKQLDQAMEVAGAAPQLPQDASYEPGFGTGAAFYGTQPDAYDPVLFGPTDTNRPVTTPPSNIRIKLSDRARLARFAEAVVANKDTVPESALLWAVRTIAGE